MSKFENITTVETITSKEDRKVIVKRCTKTGTKRIFFYPTFEGKRITTIMFARLSEAVKVGKLFLNRKPFTETRI